MMCKHLRILTLSKKVLIHLLRSHDIKCEIYVFILMVNTVTGRDSGLKRDPTRYKTRYVPANIELDNLIINITFTTKYLT